MKIILGSVCFIFLTACAQGGSTSAGGDSDTKTMVLTDGTSGKGGRASAIVTRSGSILKNAQTESVLCQERGSSAEIRLTFPSAGLTLFFQFNGPSFFAGTFDLKTPDPSVYFDGEFDGRLLTWGPELPPCTLTLSYTDQDLRGQLDCIRKQPMTSSVTDVLRIVADFQCQVSR